MNIGNKNTVINVISVCIVSNALVDLIGVSHITEDIKIHAIKDRNNYSVNAVCSHKRA